MFGPFERMVAGRYLRARKGERFVSIIAIFSLVGIALGVATLIVVTSVMSGFQVELVSRILGVNGHITIEAYAGQKLDNYPPLVSQIRALPDVASATPVLDGQALLSTEGGGARGGLVRGISLDDLRALHPISDHIVAGSLADFTGDDAIVVGVGLASAYRLRVGDPLTVISPEGAATAFGTIPRVRAYKVVAIFDAGLNDYNSGVVFLPLPAAQVFFQKPDAVTGIEIRLHDPDQVNVVGRRTGAAAARPAGLCARLAACQRHHHRRAAGAEGHDVHRAGHDRAGGGVQRGLLADHAGEGQARRHRGVAHDRCVQLLGPAHLPDVRRFRRRHRHGDRDRHRRGVLPLHRRHPAFRRTGDRRARCSMPRCSC